MISGVIMDLLSIGVRWIPLRVRTVHSIQQGVRWWWGHDTKILTKPGVYFYIPWIGDITTVDTRPKLIETQYQPIETIDGHTLSMSVGIRYRVRDARKWFTQIEDFENSLANLVQMHLYRAVSEQAYEDLKEGRKRIIGMAKKTARRAAWRWGVELIELEFITWTSVRPIQLMTGNEAVAAIGGNGV